MTLATLPAPNFSGADLSARVNAALLELRAARRLASVAALLADATLAYGTGARPVAAGDVIEAGGHRYAVAAAGASDHHIATAGGVRLFVLAGALGRAAEAFGASVTGTAAANAVALQAALNAGPGTVILGEGLFALATGLTIPAGVTLRGGGLGTTSLTNAAGRGGSTLVYSGAGVAVTLVGANAALEGLRVEGTASAQGGVLVDGNAKVVEGWRLRDVLLYGFTGGYGLKLHGENQGAVAYGEATNLRIRHAKVGLHLYDVNSISPHTGDFGFCNTNQFYGGAINGAGFDDCILIQGGNDNRIMGMSVEPYDSVNAHVRGLRGSLDFDGRMEASTKPATSPLIDIAAGCGGRIAGFIAGGMVRNAGHMRMEFQGQKNAAPHPPRGSRFRNGGSKGADLAARTIPLWTVTETGGASTWTRLAPDPVPDHDVIQIDVPAGASVEIRQSVALTAEPFATFGLWVKTAASGLAYARYNSPAGVVSSAFHGGGSVWAPLSLQPTRATSGSHDPRFVLPGGASGATYFISAPFFSVADRSDPVAYLTSAGGHVSGMIEGGGCVVTLPASGSNEFYDATLSELSLPKSGNRFLITGTARTIARINNVAAKRVAEWTNVELIFAIAGVGVTDSAYVDLRTAFTSSVGSYLSLYANGPAGTWAELARA